jgi:hypothetical protein
VRKLAAAIVVGGTALALPAGAWGQGIFQVVTSFGGTSTLPQRAVDVPVTVSGQMVVRFHGDRATGCEASGLCDTSGTITWDPGRTANLLATLEVAGRRRQSDGYISFGDYPPQSVARTVAEVRRTRADGSRAGCADVSTDASALEAHGQGVALDIGLAGGGLLSTRCGGPLDEDVASLLAVRRVTFSQLERGGSRLDLSAHGAFASHGLAGELDSTVVLTLGRGRHQNLIPPHLRFKRRRMRVLDVSYALEQLSGQVAVDFAAGSQPALCDALDACDLSGTVALAPVASSGDAHLFAEVPERVSALALLQRTGLVNGRAGKPVPLLGLVGWKGSGAITATTSRPDGSACIDRNPMTPNVIFLRTSGGALHADYTPLGQSSADPLRGRCPGPSTGDVGRAQALATATVPLAAVRQPTLTLRFTRGAGFGGDGYSGVTKPDLTLVLKRTRVRERVVTERIQVDPIH